MLFFACSHFVFMKQVTVYCEHMVSAAVSITEYLLLHQVAMVMVIFEYIDAHKLLFHSAVDFYTAQYTSSCFHENIPNSWLHGFTLVAHRNSILFQNLKVSVITLFNYLSSI